MPDAAVTGNCAPGYCCRARAGEVEGKRKRRHVQHQDQQRLTCNARIVLSPHTDGSMAAEAGSTLRARINATDQQRLWEVRAIVARRQDKSGISYLVRWKGFPASENTWEPAAGLEGSQELVEAFEQQRAQQPVESVTPQRVSRVRTRESSADGEERPSVRYRGDEEEEEAGALRTNEDDELSLIHI